MGYVYYVLGLILLYWNRIVQAVREPFWVLWRQHSFRGVLAYCPLAPEVAGGCSDLRLTELRTPIWCCSGSAVPWDR